MFPLVCGVPLPSAVTFYSEARRIFTWYLSHVVESLHLTGLFVPCPVYRCKWQRRAEPVNALHDVNYVHASLRESNNSIVTDDWRITDFSWCGKAGTVRYLADILLIPDIGWYGRVRLEGLITMEHAAITCQSF